MTCACKSRIEYCGAGSSGTLAIETEEAWPGPVCAGDGAGDGREGPVGLAVPEEYRLRVERAGVLDPLQGGLEVHVPLPEFVHDVLGFAEALGEAEEGSDAGGRGGAGVLGHILKENMHLDQNR